MRRTVKAWASIATSGAPFGRPSYSLLKMSLMRGRANDSTNLADYGARVTVPVTITFDDGRPAPRKRTASMPAYKRAYIDACLSPRKRPARKGRGGR